eukprot:gnl/TRDRNA2_/TRDRNA2_201133_c0_seq1.p1 gnl/TRDRNA2_/TRDRNA2_201133_c0~~gnl/TRDRNA2_/TRDRNA2_201133_c0_seq1.p1  ORF type:complete len:456 (+),score=69.64 gnl/TRDRNA2_/TRDRNA2_201133_c0_seq1:81-1448(+)
MSEPAARTNGFQRPFHPLQVASWVVFGGDCCLFILFSIPLLESTAVKALVGVSYGLSITILVLGAIRATSCNPADPHIAQGAESQHADCESDSLPFCTTCNVPVFVRSKHCRACNKCVSVFDHHCMWLNNCIGEANYRAFAVCIGSVVAFTGIILIVCLYLFVDYFLNESAVEERFQKHPLFSGAPKEVALVLLCVLGFINFPLFVLDMQLVILHCFLTWQNLTTYEYIMNKRNQELENLDGVGKYQEGGEQGKDGEKGRWSKSKQVMVRKIVTLPRCMDWIVFARCGSRKKSSKRDNIQRIDKKDGTSAGSGKAAAAAGQASGSDSDATTTVADGRGALGEQPVTTAAVAVPAPTGPPGLTSEVSSEQTEPAPANGGSTDLTNEAAPYAYMADSPPPVHLASSHTGGGAAVAEREASANGSGGSKDSNGVAAKLGCGTSKSAPAPMPPPPASKV